MNDLPSGLSNPAKRALASASIRSLKDVAKHSETEIKGLHGIGPNAIQQLKQAMAASGLSFKQAA